MDAIKFNDTSNYELMEMLGVEGAFTSLRIDPETLPEGFYKYSLRQGEVGTFGQVSSGILIDHAGDFITKKPLDLGYEGFRDVTDEDWAWSHKDFEFEAFFGVHRSLDCQIRDADAKREAQAEERGRSKGRDSRETQKGQSGERFTDVYFGSPEI